MKSSSSEGSVLRREHAPRLVALDGAQRRYVIEATLAVPPEAPAEALVALYWAVQALRPDFADLDHDRLCARFRRRAPTAEIAAWAMAKAIQALPDAQLTRVEVRERNANATELVLARAVDVAAAAAPAQVAA